MIVEFDKHLVVDGVNNKVRYCSIELDLPEGYTCFGRRDDPTLCGIGKFPGTIGTLWVTWFRMPNETQSIEVFEKWGKEPKTILMDINGHPTWFNIEEQENPEDTSFFWRDYTGNMTLYQYVMRLGRVGIMFTYRIPSDYEDNGLFDKEHPIMMQIMGSIKEMGE